MITKKPAVKKSRDSEMDLPEIALAAMVSYKKQKEVGEFITFLLSALDRNSTWLNSVVERQNNFRCALLVGSGPNRFQLHQIIYPNENNDLKLAVEMRDSEDFDKIAIAALLRLSNAAMDVLLKFIKTRLSENMLLREDLIKGKALGINFAVLRPISDKQYRVMERIVVGSSLKCVVPATPPLMKKRRKEEKPFNAPPMKKTRKVA